MNGPDIEGVLVSPSLHWLNYQTRPDMLKLSALAMHYEDDHLIPQEPWHHWRDILENIGAASIGYRFLMNVTDCRRGQAHEDVFYHSKALVSFSQSAIELMAIWMHAFFDLGLEQPTQIAFHTKSYKQAAKDKAPDLCAFLDFNIPTIEMVKEYRRCWHHRGSGGVGLFCDRNPGEPGAILTYAVPIDPKLDEISKYDQKNYVAAVAKCSAENGGRWLYPLHEFAELIFRGTEQVCAACLELALNRADARMEVHT